MVDISIVTPSFNSEAAIRDTLLSVASQQGVKVQHIIIDGGSSDQTLALVRRFGMEGIEVVSEPDGGLYHAMNKGVSLARGKVVGILNSDDFYAHNFVLRDVCQAFVSRQAQIVYGDLKIVDRDNTSITKRLWHSGHFSERKLYSGWAPAHPAFFCLKEVYNLVGKFRTDLSLSADYEFMLRCFLKFHLPSHYLPEVLTVMRDGGKSGRNFLHRLQGWKQVRRAWLINQHSAPPFLITRRLLSKIGQYRLFK